MPTVRPKKKNPKVGNYENAEIKSKWDNAIKGRTGIYCPERKAMIYTKNKE